MSIRCAIRTRCRSAMVIAASASTKQKWIRIVRLPRARRDDCCAESADTATGKAGSYRRDRGDSGDGNGRDDHGVARVVVR